MTSIDKINQKHSKIKIFSKYLYFKLQKQNLSEIIPDTFLTSTGTTKLNILNDAKKILRCSKTVNYKTATYKTKKNEIDQPTIEQRTTKFITNYCNIPLVCPTCAEKLSRQRFNLIKPQINNLQKKYPYIYFLTFTTRDDSNFNDNYNLLNDSLRRFFLKGQLRNEGKRSTGEAAKIRASIITKEIKTGKNSKNYHIHAHSIVFCDERLDYSIYDSQIKQSIIDKFKATGKKPEKEDLQPAIKYTKKIETVNQDTGEIQEKIVPLSKLSAEWHDCTGGKGVNIHSKIIATPHRHIDINNLNSTIREATKYYCKINDFGIDKIIEILANRKGKRYFSTTGDLYNPESSDEAVSEEIELNELFGFNFNPVNDKMEKLGIDHENRLYDQIERIEKYNEYKKRVMTAYYLKESMIKNIIEPYRQFTKAEPETLKNENLKKSVIYNIDALTKTYFNIKRVLYKKIILNNDSEILPAMESVNIKPMFIKALHLQTA